MKLYQIVIFKPINFFFFFQNEFSLLCKYVWWWQVNIFVSH